MDTKVELDAAFVSRCKTAFTRLSRCLESWKLASKRFEKGELQYERAERNLRAAYNEYKDCAFSLMETVSKS